VAKFVLRSPVLKVQFASQQFPHSGSGNLPNLLCLAYLLIVDFEPEHQHFFLVARLTLFPEGAAPSSWTRLSVGFQTPQTGAEGGPPVRRRCGLDLSVGSPVSSIRHRRWILIDW
jgi:hypothetical protein